MTVWTHPKHKYFAALGLLYETCGFLTIVLSIIFNFYCDYTKEPAQCASLIAQEVKCENDVCKFTDDHSAMSGSGFQVFVFWLTIISVALNGTAFLAQLLIFWPLVHMGNVVNGILRFCTYADFVTGFCKFVSAFMILYGQLAYNFSYVEYVQDAVAITLLPVGLIHFSTIFSFLACSMLRVAYDEYDRGHPTHLVLIEEEMTHRRHQDLLGTNAVRRTVCPSCFQGLCQNVEEFVTHRGSSVYRPSHIRKVTTLHADGRSSTSIY